MTVFRDARRNNRWTYEFEVGKKRYSGVCDRPDGTPARSKPEATDAESAARARARAEQGMAKSGLRPGGYLLAQALLLHIANQVDSSASHIDSLKRVAAEQLAFFGPARAVRDLTDADIAAYRQFCFDQPRKVWIGGPRKRQDGDNDNPRLWKILPRRRSASEVDHCLDCLRSALAVAHRVKDPVTGEPMLPFPPEVKGVHVPKRKPRPMPEGELADRLETAPPWVIDAAGITRLFGLRLAEALLAGRRHLDREDRCLRFPGEENKSGDDQRAFGGEAGWDLLLRLECQALDRGQEHLVTWPGLKAAKAMAKGLPEPEGTEWRPLKTIRGAWNRTAARAGIEHRHRFHDIRAKYITDVARLASGPLTKILARHASMATTQRYIDIEDDEAARMANRAAKRRAKLKVVK